MLPLIPSLQEKELGPPIDATRTISEYLSSTLIDLFIVSTITIICAVYGLYHAYKYGDTIPDDDLSEEILSERRYLAEVVPFPPPAMRLRHANGDRKSREELQEEALEEHFCSWARRYTTRFYFPCQLLSIVQGILIILKCLARLNEEIGVLHEAVSPHPLFWIALSVNGLACCIITLSLEPIGNVLWKLRESSSSSYSQSLSSSLLPFSRSFMCASTDDQDLNESLLPKTKHPNRNGNHSGDSPFTDIERVGTKGGENQRFIYKSSSSVSIKDIPMGTDPTRAESDITSDSHYKAGWKDLFYVCRPDLHLIILAFVFLILAAVCQVLIPRYTGNILDSLAHYSSSDNSGKGKDIWDIPGFLPDMKKLLVCVSMPHQMILFKVFGLLTNKNILACYIFGRNICWNTGCNIHSHRRKDECSVEGTIDGFLTVSGYWIL